MENSRTANDWAPFLPLSNGFYSSRGIEGESNVLIQAAISRLSAALTDARSTPAIISRIVGQAHRSFFSAYGTLPYRLVVWSRTKDRFLICVDPWIGAPAYYVNTTRERTFCLSPLMLKDAIRRLPPNPEYSERLRIDGFSTRSCRSRIGLSVLEPGKCVMVTRSGEASPALVEPIDVSWSTVLRPTDRDRLADPQEILSALSDNLFEGEHRAGETITVLVGGADSIGILSAYSSAPLHSARNEVHSSVPLVFGLHWTSDANEAETAALLSFPEEPLFYPPRLMRLPSIVPDDCFDRLEAGYTDSSGIELGVAFQQSKKIFDNGIIAVGTGADALFARSSSFPYEYAEHSFDLDILPLWRAAESVGSAITFPYYGLVPAVLAAQMKTSPIRVQKECFREHLGLRAFPKTGLPHALRGIIISKYIWAHS